MMNGNDYVGALWYVNVHIFESRLSNCNNLLIVRTFIDRLQQNSLSATHAYIGLFYRPAMVHFFLLFIAKKLY